VFADVGRLFDPAGCGRRFAAAAGDTHAAICHAFPDGLAISGAWLSVGPSPAVVANAVLGTWIERSSRAPTHRRRVDDVVAATGPQEAGLVLVRLRSALEALGLRLNDAKTRVVVDPRSIRTTTTISMARGSIPVG
jgi:hypothetical protein